MAWNGVSFPGDFDRRQHPGAYQFSYQADKHLKELGSLTVEAANKDLQTAAPNTAMSVQFANAMQ